MITVGSDYERQVVDSVTLADLRPGDRLSIEIENTSSEGQFSVTVEMWPLFSAVTAADAATGHVAMSVDVLSFPERELVMRGLVPMPSVINVGDTLDYLSLGQSRKLAPEWRGAFAKDGLAQRLRFWRETTYELVDLMSLEAGTGLVLRGESREVSVLTSWKAGAPMVTDSIYAWDSSQAQPDSTCDMVVKLGRPFRWADGSIAEVIAISFR